MDSGVRGMNPVAMTTSNPHKENWLCRGSNQRPPVLGCSALPTELWGLAPCSISPLQTLLQRRSHHYSTSGMEPLCIFMAF